MNATPQELHSQRLTSASLSKQDATSEGTVRNERCYKIQSRRHKQAPQHEPDKSTPVRTTQPVTPVVATLPFPPPTFRGRLRGGPPPVPLSKGWTNVRESGRRRPSTTKGRGYSTSSGLTERRRTALLKRPNSGPTAWQRGQTLELKDGPKSNPRKRGDETKLPSPSQSEGDACEARRGCTKPNNTPPSPQFPNHTTPHPFHPSKSFTS